MCGKASAVMGNEARIKNHILVSSIHVELVVSMLSCWCYIYFSYPPYPIPRALPRTITSPPLCACHTFFFPGTCFDTVKINLKQTPDVQRWVYRGFIWATVHPRTKFMACASEFHLSPGEGKRNRLAAVGWSVSLPHTWWFWCWHATPTLPNLPNPSTLRGMRRTQ